VSLFDAGQYYKGPSLGTPIAGQASHRRGSLGMSRDSRPGPSADGSAVPNMEQLAIHVAAYDVSSRRNSWESPHLQEYCDLAFGQLQV
jgi:hypothetical protein